MPGKKRESNPTRASLINRLKNPEDHAAWQEFQDLYGKLIAWAARERGLTEDEVSEVVQRTLISVQQHIANFQYDPRKSFKSWLLRATRWRIVEVWRERLPVAPQTRRHSQDAERTPTITRLPDPGADFDQRWDEQWRQRILETALQRVKARVNFKHWQVFDLHVNKACPVAKVAALFKITEEQVYVIKSRVRALLKEEAQNLDTGPS